ncbi:TetR family transcriptional regulator [Sporolactobacillus pectinivorans]|uniref:TetR family transcriptional regulator n=1 Tax=Sporolactobacillus pectinivorans TaxID=1591408 RepID=UPI000C25C1D4|nr:TetR family transcriptional regulator [Sporolactobacillus pectinivorans]
MPKVTKEHLLKRRMQILEAAKTVFCRKGFEPATMQDVVDASGMSRGGVYQYFSSTEEMMRALLAESDQTFEQFIDSLIKKHKRLWAVLEEYLEDLEGGAENSFTLVVLEYFVSGWRTEERKRYLRKRYEKANVIIIRIFEEGVKRGEFFPVQPIEAITQFVMNVNDGVLIESVLLNDQTVGVSNQISALKMYLKQALGVKDQEGS